MSERLGTGGGGRYSKVIRGLREAIVTIEKVTSQALQEKDDEILRLNGLLEGFRAAATEPTALQVPDGMSEEHTENDKAAQAALAPPAPVDGVE